MNHDEVEWAGASIFEAEEGGASSHHFGQAISLIDVCLSRTHLARSSACPSSISRRRTMIGGGVCLVENDDELTVNLW